MPILSPLDPDANLLARLAKSMAAPGDRHAAVLAFLTAFGAYIGRVSKLLFRDREIYPTLYAMILGPREALYDWYSFCQYICTAPVTRTGISTAESLVHLVRDAVYRPDKVAKEPDEDPEWRDTRVDKGAVDKRRLILQPLGPQLGGRGAASKRLMGLLNGAYISGEVNAYLNYRDGGFHGTATAHICLLVPEQDEQRAAALIKQMPLLVARAEGPALYSEMSDDIAEVLNAIEEAIYSPLPQVNVAPDAVPVIEAVMRSNKPYAGLTLLRLAHVLAVLERSPVATRAVFVQSQAILEASESTCERLCANSHVSRADQILNFVRSSPSGSRARNKITKKFRGQKADDLERALAELERTRQLIRVQVETSGRYRWEWRLP